MTRKRYIKLLMAAGWARNEAEETVGFTFPRTHDYCGTSAKFWDRMDERHQKYAMTYRGSWPYSTYERAYDNYTALLQRYHDNLPCRSMHERF